MADNLKSLFTELSKLGAAKGGRARANVLTKEERSEIARNAVRARWAKAKGDKQTTVEQVSSDLVKPPKKGVMKNPAGLPLALFRGNLEIGDAKFPVYVLDNFKRVMAQREVVRALTGQAHGDIARYVEAPAVRDFIDGPTILKQTIRFVISGTQFTGNGFEATLLLDICDAYLRAREAGKLASHEEAIAKQAEIITRACAKVGIIALIDEVTGYEAFKRKRDLQLKLQAFIAEDLQEWARMFRDEFWFELARLEGIHYSARSRPLRWGKYVMAFVYDAIDGDIGKKLREINPDPHFQQNHHQWLKEFGRQKVHDQIERVVTIMKLCDDMDDFRTKFARVFKKSAIAGQMSFNYQP
ncbi:MAG: P63C domain-containing protein [Candidatus Binataceae bacterium]